MDKFEILKEFINEDKKWLEEIVNDKANNSIQTRLLNESALAAFNHILNMIDLIEGKKLVDLK